MKIVTSGASGAGHRSRQAFLAGLKVVLPMLLGIFPYGVITGGLSTDAGLTTIQAVGMAVLIYAGAAQLVALQLYKAKAPLLIMLTAVALVNLRLLMYSAAIAPYFRQLSPGGKLLGGYLLTDEAFSYTVIQFDQPNGTSSAAWFYLGTAVPLWLTWQLGTVVGATIGVHVRETDLISFIIPVVFISLLVPAITDWATAAAAVAAGTAAVSAGSLPFGLELICAAAVGIATGLVVEKVMP